ncbi:MAG TPA: NADPH:quinone oxidoreductase family protein [Casimicrobium huifangae]|jgi:NADPH2:quinone reductase|uniref:NADPH:quinone oxidoreductase family protein n=1 Tax=Casimicrobium huifangae TaxID=2591109 RepID=UPI0012EC20E0|nr:NADPH:quinone oxidoreductase family protein [Casimicrobium huifangae]HOB02092.1 NADPH:quinone oxidoreductase family protein [Casimicrobium huifangae]HQA33857.1 NADPH:quinone oxidoreductase family protein [Casimicrobium huifangae]HQD65054.1 NADPH:quinone oxidoreductase family protein [Casimicrobium huifangae]
MKALFCQQFGPIENLVVTEVPAPSLAPGKVLIDVKAASLNFPDALMVQGLYQVKPPTPFVPGAEYAGVVAAVGEGVTHVKAGDHVMAFTGWGGFAEQAVADAMRVSPMPPTMSFAQGASFVLTYATSHHALKDVAKLQAGETLLILGASGGVGTSAIQLAKITGATVIAAASSDDKLALCKSLGADHLVNYSHDDWRDQLNAIVGKKGVDVVYDAVGGPYAEPALRSLGWRGRYLVVGFAAGDIPKIPLNLALLKERQILGVYWGDSVAANPKGHLANMRELGEWFAAGKIAPSITESVGLDGARDALTRMASRQAMGKIVVTP